MRDSIRVGVDVGGTFTDIVLMSPGGRAVPKKVLSSPPHFNAAIRQGVAEALAENGVAASAVRSFTHGATVATNAIITRTGAATGLITTEGFRDVLEIRRMRMHKLYDIHWEKPAPLVARHLRREVASRVDPRTGEDSPLDESAVREAVQRLLAENVDSIAVCYLLRVPSIDLAEVGAGGGSIAWIDPAGALKVGPHSAGAVPGPACYDAGGVEPTITDANVYLGLTNCEALAGGALKIRADLAESAIRERIAEPLGIDAARAAWGIRTIANSALIRALRAVSTERGRDPRRFTLFAFGGMGPVQALDVADELGMDKVVIPPIPGLFSSLGLLFAEVEHHLVRTHYASAALPDFERLNAVIERLVEEAKETLEREGYDRSRREIELAADTRYEGQDYALTVPFPFAGTGSTLDASSLARLVEDFHREHEKTYGYRSDEENVQITGVRVVARGLSDTPQVPDRLEIATVEGWKPSGARECFFGPEHGWIRTEVMDRGDLTADRTVPGPAIIEEDNSLTVVLPEWTARLDDWSNIVLERA